MGFISNLAGSNVTKSVEDYGFRRSDTDRGRSRAVWQEIFGTDKETGTDEGYRKKPVAGGSHGRSGVSTDASVMRLLRSLRSEAPGGWSDSRYEQSRHFTGIPYVAIHRKCSMLAQADFQVFQKDDKHPDGKRPITIHDPPQGDRLVKPYDLVKLLEKPNNQDSFGKYMYKLGQQKDLTGTALTWLVPNELGVPMEMYCIPTAIAVPQPTTNPDYPNGYWRIQPLYPYGPFSSYPTPYSSVGAAIPAEWMLKFQYPHPLLHYDGYSPLTGMNLHIDEIEMIDRSRHYTMRRSINPSVVLNFDEMEGMQPLPEPEIERIRAEWEAEFQGVENHGKMIVGTPGCKIDQFGNVARDMEYPEGWNQLTAFVLGGFGITKPAAGMIEDSSYATLFATLKQVHLITLKPDCDDFAADLTRHLAHFFGDNLIIEIRLPRIDDHEILFRKIDKGVAAKCLTKNQVLKLLDFPITTEKWGDEIAGTDSQEQQQQMGGMPGMPGMGGSPGMPEQAEQPVEQVSSEGLTDMGQRLAEGSGWNQLDEEGGEPKEIMQTRPRTGKLGRGALGPKKNLNGRFSFNGAK